MINVQNAGYTILEVMIVLAVSASMFVFISITFGGRQAQVQFTQAVRDFDSRLNDIFNDVSTGYYPKNDTKVCELIGQRPKYNVGTPPELGANEDCVSIGKVIQFSPAISDSSNDNDQYISVFNVAGLRNVDGKTPLTIEDSVPTADPDAETALLKWGLKVTKVVYLNTPSTEYGAIGVFSSLNRGAQLQASDTNEGVKLNILPGTGPDMSQSDLVNEVNDINDKISNGEVDFNANPEIIICVSDANEGKRAFVAIGGNNAGNRLEFDNVGICNP